MACMILKVCSRERRVAFLSSRQSHLLAAAATTGGEDIRVSAILGTFECSMGAAASPLRPPICEDDCRTPHGLIIVRGTRRLC